MAEHGEAQSASTATAPQGVTAPRGGEDPSGDLPVTGLPTAVDSLSR